MPRTALKQTVCKLETGKHYPGWNNGGWRRQPLSTPFPEPGHPVPSVSGWLLPPLGGPGLTSGSLEAYLTPCPPWTSFGPWEEAAPPTHLPFSPASPYGTEGGRWVSSGNLVPGVLLVLGGGTWHGPPRGFPYPPSTARGCNVSPNPPFPPKPKPHTSPPHLPRRPSPETRAEPGVFTPPYTHP